MARGMALVEIDKGIFLAEMVKRYNRSELRRICFDLGIPEGSLSGDTLDMFALELIQYVRRHEMNGDLIHAVVSKRPEMLKRVEFRTGPMLLRAPPPTPDVAAKHGCDPIIDYVIQGLFSMQRLMLVQGVFVVVVAIAMLLIVIFR